MRHIARQGSWYHLDDGEIFYRQADFMKDYHDDFSDEIPFKRYYPSYQKMSHDQLRSYFSWRSRVRSGHIEDTSLSYAFLYVYELLNNIGVSDPQEGLERLVEFWNTFRTYQPMVDQYLIPWFKDYHVYYPIEGSFVSFASRYQLQEYYPTVFCSTTDSTECFNLFAHISGYRIKDSVFYTESNQDLIHRCFCHVLACLRKAFKQKGLDFDDYLFFVGKERSKWQPFAKAHFYPAFEQVDRVVHISDCEVYECTNQIWAAKTVMPADYGKQLIGYIMKEIEVFLRRVRSFKYKLTAKLDSCKAVDQREFTKLGISIPDIVKQGCADFYQRYTWKSVSVNSGNLTQIRAEAFETQEKLLVPETPPSTVGINPFSVEMANPVDPLQNEKFRPSAVYSSEASGKASAVEQVLVAEHAATQQDAAEGMKTLADHTIPPDPWTQLAEALTDIERNSLLMVMRNEPLKDYAMKHHIMLEVLVDTINEKSMDHIGDAILDIDDTVSIFEEYRETLLKAVV